MEAKRTDIRARKSAGDFRARNVETSVETTEEATALGGQIMRVMSGFGYRKEFLGWQVVSSWEKIVGERIAKISSATRFEDNVLYVKVASPLLRQNLSMETDLLLSAIKKFAGGGIVKRIHFH